MKEIYSIVDIETTGMGYGGNRITEIAIIQFDGEKVVGEFSSLVNPEQLIPPKITNLTGITNEMVADAPKFYEIAKEVFQMTENTIFVAHNVGFDYNVLGREYKSLGGAFRRKKLCTVRLSRKILPGYPSYSLGNLCAYLDITVENRHRAMGDAQATLKLFRLLRQNDQKNLIQASQKGNSREATLPPNLPREVYDKIPDSTGVYYFHNEQGKIIYIGKAKNLKKRINSHFTQGEHYKGALMQEIRDITFSLTGNELIAFLLESDEIKKHWPRYNRAQKRTREVYGICHYEDRKGYLRLAYNNLKLVQEPVASFYNIMEARHFLDLLVKEFKLCPKLCSLQTSPSSCFDFRIKQCDGACIGHESPEMYNEKVEAAIKYLKRQDETYIIVEKGRDESENGIILVEKGHYLGFGFVESEQPMTTLDEVKDHIRLYSDNKDIQRILRGYLRKNPTRKQTVKAV